VLEKRDSELENKVEESRHDQINEVASVEENLRNDLHACTYAVDK